MQRLHLSLVAISIVGNPLTAAEDPALTELAKAKAAHAKEMTALRASLLAAIDAKIKEENDRGAGIDYLLKERKGFEENGVTPILPKLIPASKEYLEGKKAADAKLVKGYTVAIAALSDRGKTTEAASLTKELQQIQGTGGEPASTSKSSSIPDDLVGTWIVTYTNGVSRTTKIQSDGTILCPEESLKARLRGDGKTFLVEFGDGKVERFVLTVDGRLLAEHFVDPKSEFSTNKPSVIGIGRRSARK